VEAPNPQTPPEKRLRAKQVPLPPTLEELVALFKRAIALPEVNEVRVNEQEVQIRRWVLDGEDVLPEEGAVDGLDPEFVLSRIELLELEFSEERHPFVSLRDATQLVTSRGLKPTHVFAPDGGWVEAFFDLPEEPPAKSVFGINIVRSASETCQEKLVVVGGNGPYLSDAVMGVVIDLGV
jgi:hypothetical protein